MPRLYFFFSGQTLFGLWFRPGKKARFSMPHFMNRRTQHLTFHNIGKQFSSSVIVRRLWINSAARVSILRCFYGQKLLHRVIYFQHLGMPTYFSYALHPVYSS